MRVKGQHHTVCSVCQRQVAAVLNWEKMQAGRLVGEYRITRHATEARSGQRGRRPICPGSGILIDAERLSPQAEPSGPAVTTDPEDQRAEFPLRDPA